MSDEKHIKRVSEIFMEDQDADRRQSPQPAPPPQTPGEGEGVGLATEPILPPGEEAGDAGKESRGA